MNKKKLDELLFVVSSVVIFLALINIGFTLYRTGGMHELTGRVSYGTANLSIQTSAAINFTTSIINWGAGAVFPLGSQNATLDSSNGTFTNWNGSSNNVGLILQNDGNVNLMINLTASNNASDFIGGTYPLYEIKTVANETSACAGLSTTYYTANTTIMSSCSNLSYIDTKDNVKINVRVRVTDDAVGVKGSTITATATAIA